MIDAFPGGVFAEESSYGSKVLRVFKVLRDINVFKVSKAVRGKGF